MSIFNNITFFIFIYSVKKAEYNTKINEIENKIATDHDQYLIT